MGKARLAGLVAGLGLGLVGLSLVLGQGIGSAFVPLVVAPEEGPPATLTSTPMATETPTVTSTPTSVAPTLTPTATSTVSPPPGCGTCAFDAYNCSDFSTQAAAQACFDYCMAQVGYDVHRLDADGDGEACESLPLTRGWVLVWPGGEN